VPLFRTHVGYIEADEVPELYRPQMYTNMLCCERGWWDFVSYCPPDIEPALPDEFRMFRKRLEADQEQFALIEEAATVTMEHVLELITRLREKYPHIERPEEPPEDICELGIGPEELAIFDRAVQQ